MGYFQEHNIPLSKISCPDILNGLIEWKKVIGYCDDYEGFYSIGSSVWIRSSDVVEYAFAHNGQMYIRYSPDILIN